VSNVSYNAANQLLTVKYPAANETRTYNVLDQLTNVTAGSGENLTYNYPTGTNNGQISSMSNAVSGETITYTYDSLNRLLTANGSGWGEQYAFDAFGNLTEKQITSGSGPSLNVNVNTANNQIQGVSGLSYDANGNQNVGTYDSENRLILADGMQYAYDAQNRRIWSWNGWPDNLGNPTGYTVNLYSPGGQKLGAYVIAPFDQNDMGNLGVTLSSSDQYFGSRRVAVMDRSGSVGTYFPWGEDKGSTNPQNTWSFATYWQDSGSGLDYANNRYYSNAYGRFMTPDPYKGNGGGPGDPNNPQSWNPYAYTTGDPVNYFDPTGLCQTATYYENGVYTGSDIDTSDCVPNGWSIAGVSILGLAQVISNGIAAAVGAPSNAAKQAAQSFHNSICSAMPSASVTSISVAAGLLTSTGLNFDLIVNLQSGEISIAGGPGLQLGIGNGAGISATTGYIWNLGPNNQNFANLNTAAAVQFSLAPGTPFAGVAQAAAASPGFGSPSINPSQGLLMAGGLAISLSAIEGLPSLTAGGSATIGVVNIGNITSPFATAAFPWDRTLYQLGQTCNP
jgi:RHS repeat-associated protein